MYSSSHLTSISICYFNTLPFSKRCVFSAYGDVSCTSHLGVQEPRSTFTISLHRCNFGSQLLCYFLLL